MLVVGGELHAPEPLGRQSLLALHGRIAQVGAIDRAKVEALGLELELIDAAGGLVTPGFIDPHEHLLGGSGERGFATQTPELQFSEIAAAGITSVVGCLGVDTTMKTMPGLLAKAKALREEGLAAWLWSGGYDVPPTTLMGSVRDDLLFIDEVIGAGEIAIADARAMDPDVHELARIVSDAHVGGLLSRKAGRTHFHVGHGDDRLKLLRALVEDCNIDAAWLYPTHISRSEALVREAVELARRGAWVDIDTVQQDLHRWLRFYLDNGGPFERLTASSDAAATAPGNLSEQVRSCMREHGWTPQQVLPLVTTHAAAALALPRKGRLAAGFDADLLVLRPGTLEIDTVLAQGRVLVRDGRLLRRERFLDESNRRLELRGLKA